MQLVELGWPRSWSPKPVEASQGELLPEAVPHKLGSFSLNRNLRIYKAPAGWRGRQCSQPGVGGLPAALVLSQGPDILRNLNASVWKPSRGRKNRSQAGGGGFWEAGEVPGESLC